MNFTAKQIEKAKQDYTNFLKIRSAKADPNYLVNPNEIEKRTDFHNNIVNKIKGGDKELEKDWKYFFLKEAVKADNKNDKRKEKLQANRKASADILAPIKKLKKIGEFGKWLNNSNNQYRKQHFNKKYTEAAVNAFLETL